MMKRRNAFFITLSALLVVCSGCRPSPVLEQVVYEQDHTEDPDQQSDDNQPDHTQQDEQLASMEQVDQARSQRDEEQNKAVSGGTAQNGSAYSAQYQEQAGNNGIDQTVPEQQTNPDNQTGSTGGGTSGQGDSQGTGGNDASGQTPSADEHTKQIVDARGVSVTVPENVDGVTATGEAGVMVGMLGGDGTSDGFFPEYDIQPPGTEGIWNRCVQCTDLVGR